MLLFYCLLQVSLRTPCIHKISVSVLKASLIIYKEILHAEQICAFVCESFAKGLSNIVNIVTINQCSAI